MSTEQNKTLIRRSFEDLNQGHLGEADEYFTPDFVYHDVANPQVSNPQECMQFLNALRTTFAGQFTIEDLVAEGNKAVARYTAHGTHRAAWRGFPPTGKPVTITGTNTYRFVNGKVAEMWQNADALSLLQQLGAVPAPGQAS